MLRSLVGSEMCIRDSINAEYGGAPEMQMQRKMPPRPVTSRSFQRTRTTSAEQNNRANAECMEAGQAYRTLVHPAWSFVMCFALFTLLGLTSGMTLRSSALVILAGGALIGSCLAWPGVSDALSGSVVPGLSARMRLNEHLQQGGETLWGRLLELGGGLMFVGGLSCFSSAMSGGEVSMTLSAVLVMPGAAGSALGCWLSELSPRWERGVHGAIAQLLSIGGAALSGSGLVLNLYLIFGGSIGLAMSGTLTVIGISLYLSCFALHEMCGWKAQKRGVLVFLHMLIGLVMAVTGVAALANLYLGWSRGPIVTSIGFAAVISGRKLVPASNNPVVAQQHPKAGSSSFAFHVRTLLDLLGLISRPPTPAFPEQPVNFSLVRLTTQPTECTGGEVSPITYSVTSLLVVAGRVLIVYGTVIWVRSCLQA
eukprot:TRINITY_DN3754_c0_g1_i1.p1 TRINITY_DN3754_c0_g1~~TRINITY_DN3754_c0_g1_i1.p1  ORF type:complete len:473 (+),score=93.97 TRINITY_DN3754_c0_g1_i1:148-1419(+)